MKMTNQPPLGLRERQRRLTTDLIQHATLTLLEQQGWEATTVAEIAAQAGVSPRTFFRYFDSKEHAAFPAHRRLSRAVSTFTPTSTSLERVTNEVIELMHSAMVTTDDPEEQELHKRIARLFGASPHLHVVASTQDASVIQLLHERLMTTLPDAEAVVLRGIVESAMALWRTAWWHWGARLDAIDSASPADSFETARRAIQEARCL